MKNSLKDLKTLLELRYLNSVTTVQVAQYIEVEERIYKVKQTIQWAFYLGRTICMRLKLFFKNEICEVVRKKKQCTKKTHSY